ncbi:class I SAM-dependent methyltransferase [Amaricoccus sp.]|uniref:class I SAM-dependent methyltransferase n=1 Tax=Amaricoccus sp. TaxID=1872485 RepID=UPI0026359138|nr:class I SAM-dependent methyltransferase [Amaricoccus sp.]HRO13014.1 class I SAM-dependent methyltransferase [Amaricoccus sp.]
MAVVTETTEYVDFWNEILVPKFVRWKHILVDGLAHHSAAVFPRLEVPAGGRVVDVGCGFGDTAIELARRVGPEGEVLGIDCCDAFLEFGRRDAAAAGIRNLRFVEADVQAYPFEGDFDLCFSRFGTQFFENPVAALRNMRRSLRPGGRMVMIVWRSLEENEVFRLPKEVVSRFLPPPGEDARTCGPGPFSMADPEVVAKQLEIAGYEGPRFERIDALLRAGETPEEAVAFQMALGPAGEIVREAGEIAEAKRPEIEAALTEELARYRTAEGIMLDTSSWMVSARNPG